MAVEQDAGRTTACQQYNITAAKNAPSGCRKIEYQAAVVNFPPCLRKGERGKESLAQTREEPLTFLFTAPSAPPHDRAADGSCAENNNYPHGRVKIHNTLLILKLRLQ